MNRGRADRWSEGLLLAALAALPLAGVGVVRLATGRDLGAGFQPSYLLMAAAVAFAGLARGPRSVVRGWADAGGRPWLWALAALAVSALGVWRLPPPATAAEAWARYGRQMLQWGVMAVFSLHVAAWLGAAPGRWRRAVEALLVGLALQVVYGIWQAWSFRHPGALYAAAERVATSNPAILSGSEELYLGRDFVGVPRLRGTACEPLYLGSYLLALLPWALWWAREAGERARRIRWLPAAAGVLLLAATWSRGAWLAAGFGAVVALAASVRAGAPPARRTLWIGAGAVLAAAVAAAVLTGGEVFVLFARRLRQMLSTEDWSNLTRWYSMQAAWRGFLAAPWTGLGWGMYGFHFPLLVDPMGLQSQFAWPVTNNMILKVMCETGVPGSVALIAGAREVVGRAARALRSGDPGVRRRAVAALAAAAAVGAQLLTFSQYNLPHLWVCLGMLMAAGGPARAVPEEPS